MSTSMLWPLGLTTLGFTLGFGAIVLARLRASVMESRIRTILAANRGRQSANPAPKPDSAAV